MSSQSPTWSPARASAISRAVVEPLGTPWARRTGVALLVAYLLFTNAFLSIAESSVNLDHGFNRGPQLLMKIGVSLLCGLYGLWNFPLRDNAWWKFPGLWMSLLLVWCVIVSPFALNPRFAIQATVSLALISIFIPAVIVNLGLARVVRIMFWTIFAFVLASALVYTMNPSLAPPETKGDFRVAGFAHPTVLARYCVFLFLLAICGKQELTVHWKWCLLLIVMVMLGTRTRTAIATAVACVVFLVFRKQELRRRVLFANLGLALLACVVLLVFGLWGIDLAHAKLLLVRSDPEELVTGNGRFEIWADALKMFGEAPWLGCGHGCHRFKFLALAHPDDFFIPLHSHNQWLDMLVSLGVCGGLLTIAMYAHLAWDAVRLPIDWVDTLFLAFALESITESPLFNVIPGIDTALWLVILYARQYGQGTRNVPRRGGS